MKTMPLDGVPCLRVEQDAHEETYCLRPCCQVALASVNVLGQIEHFAITSCAAHSGPQAAAQTSTRLSYGSTTCARPRRSAFPAAAAAG